MTIDRAAVTTDEQDRQCSDDEYSQHARGLVDLLGQSLAVDEEAADRSEGTAGPAGDVR
jgi:hypothetical protein